MPIVAYLPPERTTSDQLRQSSAIEGDKIVSVTENVGVY